MHADSIPENFFQTLYPTSELPPLWEVIYQEAMRGHHLLFQRNDVEIFENQVRDDWYQEESSEEIELLVLKVLGCSELGEMVKVIDTTSIDARRRLFAFYKRSLLLWSNYSKSRLN